MKDLRLGTSGWSYEEWVGPVYSDEKERKLSKYSTIFSTAEIDSTFYAYPSKGTIIGLGRYSPAGFTFAAKLPKVITHNKVLGAKEGIEDELYKFLQLVEPLSSSGKIACILVQLPPSLKFDSKTLENFLGLLPKDLRFAVEFRHLSWLRAETWQLLSNYNVAYTVVDEPLLPPDLKITSDLSYFRWHGHGRRPWYDYRYTLDELKPWVPKIKEAEGSSEHVYGFFNNHYHGYAVENCLQVLDMLGALTESQAKALKHVQKWLTDHPLGSPSKATMHKLPLGVVTEPTGSLESHLLKFTDRARLERARTIEDKEVQILEKSGHRITSRIKEYQVVVDLDHKTVAHDCPDWTRESKDRRFCKHVARLFLALENDKATAVLEQISKQGKDWEFKTLR
jgi:uncharacterized protein YecE (DUF72 family)